MDSCHAYFAEKLHHHLKGGLGTSDDAVVRVVVSHSEVSVPMLGYLLVIYVRIPAHDMFEYLLVLLASWIITLCILDDVTPQSSKNNTAVLMYMYILVCQTSHLITIH